MSEAPTPTLLRQLRAGRLGIAVIGVGAGLPGYDLDGLSRQIVLAGRLRVAVPNGHRLASAGIVAAAELAGETWIAGDDSGGDPQFRAWPTIADPAIGYTVRGWPARFGLVAAGWASAWFLRSPRNRFRLASPQSASRTRGGWDGRPSR